MDIGEETFILLRDTFISYLVITVFLLMFWSIEHDIEIANLRREIKDIKNIKKCQHKRLCRGCKMDGKMQDSCLDCGEVF